MQATTKLTNEWGGYQADKWHLIYV